MFAADTPGHSACEGSCLQYWPVVRAPASLPASIPGVTAKVGVLDRPDGTKQLTVAGWPVYTFAGDSGPGATAGQGKNASGGLWWVLSPDGKIIKGSGSATTSAGTRGGYGGY
jgi:predicted lipoprotein with Yx(FWY)xxD motif